MSCALKAVTNGETAVGIRAKNDIVIATEKKLTNLLADEISIHNIENLYNYMIVTYSGTKTDLEAFILSKDVEEVIQE